jgi:hypothetical protein
VFLEPLYLQQGLKVLGKKSLLLPRQCIIAITVTPESIEAGEVLLVTEEFLLLLLYISIAGAREVICGQQLVVVDLTFRVLRCETLQVETESVESSV